MRRTLGTSRQFRCSRVFSTVWLASPLASLGCSSPRCPAWILVGTYWCFHTLSISDISFQWDMPLLTLLGSECCVIQASGPHRTPTPLPAFLPGSTCQECPPSWPATFPLPVAMAPEVPFLRHRLRLVRGYR